MMRSPRCLSAPRCRGRRPPLTATKRISIPGPPLRRTSPSSSPPPKKTTNDGDYGQAGTGFQTAHWIGYDASNFSKAVNDTISADKQQALLTQFTDLEGLAYQQGQGDAISGAVDALDTDLAATAQTLDGNANLADPKTYAKQRAEQTAAERKKLDAAKKNSSKGKGDRTWSEVASEMNVILDKAYKAAISGKGAEGSSLVNDAYYQYYEKLGFERTS